MKKLLITAFALLLAAPVFAVDKKSQPTKHDPTVSMFMREAALDYIDLDDKSFIQAGRDYVDVASGDSAVMLFPGHNDFGDAMIKMEDHLALHATTEGDKKFLEFLRNLRTTTTFAFTDFLSTTPQFKNMTPHPATAKLWRVCIKQAKTIADTGVFAEGDCSQWALAQALSKEILAKAATDKK